MDCKEAEKLVQPYIEEKLSDEQMESFIFHVRKCPSCYDELETYYTIRYALRYMDDRRNVSYDMKKIVAEDLRKKEAQIHRRRTRKIAFYVMTAVTEGLLAAAAFFACLPDQDRNVLEQIMKLLSAGGLL